MIRFRKQGENEGWVNVGRTERRLSVAIGAVLLGTLGLKGPLRWVRLGLGLVMVERSITGFCTPYKLLGITTVEPQEGRVVALPLKRGIEIERSVTVNKPRDEVYAFWRDLSNLPRFMRHLESVTELDNASGGASGGARSHWVAKAPIQVEWEAEITAERPGELIGWRSMDGSSVRNAGSVRFKDALGGKGTEVHVYLEYQPVGGPAGAAVAKLMKQVTLQQIRMDMGRFKAILEAGEAPTTEGQTSGREKLKPGQLADARPAVKRKDVVNYASDQSFPASDPPAWIGNSVGADQGENPSGGNPSPGGQE
jgi:uncharacterized membrane protein